MQIYVWFTKGIMPIALATNNTKTLKIRKHVKTITVLNYFFFFFITYSFRERIAVYTIHYTVHQASQVVALLQTEVAR